MMAWYRHELADLDPYLSLQVGWLLHPIESELKSCFINVVGLDTMYQSHRILHTLHAAHRNYQCAVTGLRFFQFHVSCWWSWRSDLPTTSLSTIACFALYGSFSHYTKACGSVILHFRSAERRVVWLKYVFVSSRYLGSQPYEMCRRRLDDNCLGC